MIRENSGTIWYGVYIAIVFFALRFLFEAWDYPLGQDYLKSAWAGGIALPVGLLIGYVLRNQQELLRFFIAGAMLIAAVVSYIFLT